ncbi:hypothetical protein SAVIM40S_05522 [Streptomyces avidinii]|uniref:Uncharacterized protein n=1 Tax=Streptomyces avidinii TaxID=1895 RepID=A0ABS4LHV1_STRAV|nr:hypothetical protein [Streptomyces avidinii]
MGTRGTSLRGGLGGAADRVSRRRTPPIRPRRRSKRSSGPPTLDARSRWLPTARPRGFPVDAAREHAREGRRERLGRRTSPPGIPGPDVPRGPPGRRPGGVVREGPGGAPPLGVPRDGNGSVGRRPVRWPRWGTTWRWPGQAFRRIGGVRGGRGPDSGPDTRPARYRGRGCGAAGRGMRSRTCPGACQRLRPPVNPRPQPPNAPARGPPAHPDHPLRPALSSVPRTAHHPLPTAENRGRISCPRNAAATRSPGYRAAGVDPA